MCYIPWSLWRRVMKQGASWTIEQGFGWPFGGKVNALVEQRIREQMVAQFPLRQPQGNETSHDWEWPPCAPLKCRCHCTFVRRDSLQGQLSYRDRFDVDSMFLVYRLTTCNVHAGICRLGARRLAILRENGRFPGEIDRMDVTLLSGEYSMVQIVDEIDRCWVRWLQGHMHPQHAKAYMARRPICFGK